MLEEAIIERIKTGAKVRVYDQSGRFEGIVLARKHGREAGATFTVRAVVADVGVEKVFPLKSPAIKKVEIMSAPKKVRRAKIYYVRSLSKKRTRKKLGTTV